MIDYLKRFDNIEILFFIKFFMLYKKYVLGRIEQSFMFYKDNFFNLSMLIGIFYLIIFNVFWYIWSIITLLFNEKEIFSPLNIFLAIILFLMLIIYLVLEIWVIISLYKTIIDIDWKKEIDLKANFRYWISNITNLIKIYYYIFIYVFLLPSLLLIFGWFYFLYLQYNHLINLVWIDYENIIKIIFSFVLFIWIFTIYIVYKSNKAIFSIPWAISKNDFNKESFNKTINLTNWNWWRIFWNFLLVWIIISILSWIINSIFQINNFFEFQKLFTHMDLHNLNSDKILNEIKNGNIFEESFFVWFLKRIIMIITITYTSIFTYIFYKRLEEESLNLKKSEEI